MKDIVLKGEETCQKAQVFHMKLDVQVMSYSVNDVMAKERETGA